MLLGVCFPVGPSFIAALKPAYENLWWMREGKGLFLRNPHKGDKRGILPPIVFYPLTNPAFTNSSNSSFGVMGMALTATPVDAVKSSAKDCTCEKRVSSAQMVRVARVSLEFSDEFGRGGGVLLQAARAVAAAKRRVLRCHVACLLLCWSGRSLHQRPASYHCNTSIFVSATIFRIVGKLLHL